MLRIDDFAYKSQIAGYEPKGKLFFALLPLLIVLVASDILVSVATLIVMSGLILKFSGVSWKILLGLLSIPLGFLLIGTITIIFGKYDMGTNLVFGFTLGNSLYGISNDSLIMGAGLIFRSLACVSCMYFISLNIPMVELFVVFRDWKVPTLIVSLMELIYRYIFVVLEESSRIWVAQSSRGAGFDFGSRLRAISSLAASLLQRSFARSYRVSTALEARGYDGNFYSLSKSYFSSKWFYFGGIGFAAVLIILKLWR